jgi:hypothetical protein
MQDPRLINASVTWDHTPLQAEALAVLPLRTSGSICLPEKVAYDPDAMSFELGFLTSWEEVSGAPTYLWFFG